MWKSVSVCLLGGLSQFSLSRTKSGYSPCYHGLATAQSSEKAAPDKKERNSSFFSFQSVARRLLKAFPLQVHKQVQPKTITVQRVESAFSEAFPSHSSSWSVPLSCSFPQRKNCTALWYKIILAYLICPFFFFPPFQVFSVNSLTMIEMIGTCSVSVWDANRWYL